MGKELPLVVRGHIGQSSYTGVTDNSIAIYKFYYAKPNNTELELEETHSFKDVTTDMLEIELSNCIPCPSLQVSLFVP